MGTGFLTLSSSALKLDCSVPGALQASAVVMLSAARTASKIIIGHLNFMVPQSFIALSSQNPAQTSLPVDECVNVRILA
jgi:hypothetical protein